MGGRSGGRKASDQVMLTARQLFERYDPATDQGHVSIRAERSARWLDVVVHDDGRGLPEGFSLEKSDRLGLQIVRTLVAAELDGSLGMHDVATGGTDVVLRVPLGRKTRLPQ